MSAIVTKAFRNDDYHTSFAIVYRKNVYAVYCECSPHWIDGKWSYYPHTIKMLSSKSVSDTGMRAIKMAIMDYDGEYECK